MATTTTDETLRLCRLAMYQLRQDVGVPSTTAAAALDYTVLWKKCRECFEVAFAEVLNAHNWTWKRVGTAVVDYSTKPDNWPDDAKNALIYTLARELAIPVAGRVEDLKNCSELATRKLIHARLTNLTAELTANTDPVLARLVGNFKADDPALINAFSVYTARATTVKAACDSEVKKTLGIVTLDDLATECSRTLACARLCRVCGLDANDEQLLMQEYQAKILQWRKVKLDETRTSDLVLDQLVGLFKGDDAALANAWSVYELRKNTVLAQCTEAAKQAFEVNSATLSGVPALAANCLAVAKLAPAFGLDASVAQVQMAEYDKLLAEYKQQKLSDLISASNESTEPFMSAAKEVRKTLGIANGTALDDLAKGAARCLCYSMNGERYGYDANFVQSKVQEYQAKILQWRKVKLDEELSANTDPILSEMLAPFKGDDSRLVNAFSVYSNKVAAISSACEREVRSHYDLWENETNTTGTVSNETFLFNSANYTLATNTLTMQWARERRWYAPWESLMKAKLASAMGLDGNAVQAYNQEYALKLNLAMKNELNELLAANTDPVLAELVQNFKGDDAGLVNTFTVYTSKSSAVKGIAEAEINAAHKWQTAFDWDAASASSHIAYFSWVALCASKLSASFGLDAGTQQLIEQKYQAAVRSAAVSDLSDELVSVSDADDKEVLSRVIGVLSSADSRVPFSLDEIIDKLDANKDHVREEIITSHNWSSFRDEMAVESAASTAGDVNYPFSTAIPQNCSKVLECRDGYGRRADWKIVGGQLRSVNPIMTITYARDEQRLDRWPSLCRAAYISLLAADVAAAVTGSSGEAQRLRQAYERDLETAKLSDSRGTGSRRETRGRNFYADAMTRGGCRWHY